MALGSGGPSLALADKIRSILAHRGLSLAEVARRSRELFPDDHRFHIPPNLYHILRRRGFSPGIHQIFVLSRLSNHRLVDWLALFGVVLEDIPRLETVLPARYTTLIDAGVYEARTWMLSFEPTTSGLLTAALRPLGECFRLSLSRRNEHVRRAAESGSMYAKIGCQDDFAFPDLLPGSIVRVTRSDAPSFRDVPIGRNGAFFLLEHARGLTCSRLHAVERNRVVLCPPLMPFAHIELEIGREARILGALEFELRPTHFTWPARVSRSFSEAWTPALLEPISSELSFDRLLRRARRRSGLTFREASAKSALVARALQNKQFFCAAGSLSDYESNISPPRHVHKLFSLCVLYSLNFWELLTAAGLRLSEAGRDGIPDEFLDRAAPRPPLPNEHVRPHRPLLEFPYFFGRAAAALFQMDHLSIRDLFWTGRPRPSFHPYLADAIVLILDRRKKRIMTVPHAPLWAQPLYVLLRRDGEYVCSSCCSNGTRLVMRPFSNGFDRPLRFKSPGEMEVIGRVVAILRRTLPRKEV